VTADQDHLRRHLAQFEEKPGVFVERTQYKIDLIIWDKTA